MTLETVNLVKAKALSGDVLWLTEKFRLLFEDAPLPNCERVSTHLHLRYGFLSVHSFNAGASDAERLAAYPPLCIAMLTGDFSKLDGADPLAPDTLEIKVNGEDVSAQSAVDRIVELAKNAGATVTINHQIIINTK